MIENMLFRFACIEHSFFTAIKLETNLKYIEGLFYLRFACVKMCVNLISPTKNVQAIYQEVILMVVIASINNKDRDNDKICREWVFFRSSIFLE